MIHSKKKGDGGADNQAMHKHKSDRYKSPKRVGAVGERENSIWIGTKALEGELFRNFTRTWEEINKTLSPVIGHVF